MILEIIGLATLAAVAIGVLTLSSVPLSETVLISADVMALTVGCWGGIWYSEKQGWAHLLAEQGIPDETATEERDEEIVIQESKCD